VSPVASALTHEFELLALPLVCAPPPESPAKSAVTLVRSLVFALTAASDAATPCLPEQKWL